MSAPGTGTASPLRIAHVAPARSAAEAAWACVEPGFIGPEV